MMVVLLLLCACSHGGENSQSASVRKRKIALSISWCLLRFFFFNEVNFKLYIADVEYAGAKVEAPKPDWHYLFKNIITETLIVVFKVVLSPVTFVDDLVRESCVEVGNKVVIKP